MMSVLTELNIIHFRIIVKIESCSAPQQFEIEQHSILTEAAAERSIAAETGRDSCL
jgi:hypothetical protein